MTSPSVVFLGIEASKVKNAMTSPSLQVTSESKTKADMPLSLVIGQETIKTALILLAVNPNIGGLVIAGGKVPVNVMEDRLFGSVDVKKTLESGQTVFTPGLLASAHRGILYIDDINLLDAITDGFVIVEREGISVKYPCKPMLIATLNPADSELKDVFLDRIGIALNADSEPLTMDERVAAVKQVLDFSEGKLDPALLAEDNEKEDENDEDDVDENDEEEEEEDQEEQGEPSIPEEFMFDAVGVPLEDDMMKFGGRQKAGKGGKSGLIMSRDRGRYLRPVAPKEGEPIRVAIDATLREAAKNQVWRRKEAAALGKDATRIFLEPSDVRAKLMARKAGSLLIFAVDASGSMALNRMNAAKGAACGLLTEAYQSRDKIALIPFQGQAAEVLLPPTRSISMAKNRLDMTGVNAMSSGDVGRCVIVLISDGRANVPLDVSLGIEPAEPAPTGADGKPCDGSRWSYSPRSSYGN
eukprot:gene19063-19415_t